MKISLLLNSSAPIVPFDENLFPSFLRYNALHRLIPLLILLLHNKNQQYNLLLLFAFENELYISAKNNTKAFAPTESYYFSTLWPIRYCFFDKVSLKSLCLNHVEILIEPLALPPCLPLMMGAQRKRCCLARSAGRRERKRSCPHRWNAVALSPLPQSASQTAPSADGAKRGTVLFALPIIIPQLSAPFPPFSRPPAKSIQTSSKTLPIPKIFSMELPNRAQGGILYLH